MTSSVEKLFKRAQDLLESKSIFNLGNSKYKKAASMFEEAAKSYRASSNFEKSGKCYEKQAECYLKLKDIRKAADAMLNAATQYDRYSTREGIRCLEIAIKYLCEEGRFTKAAQVEKEIGECYEGLGEWIKAAEHFKKAADYYEGEHAIPNALACRESQCSALISGKQFKDAMNAYEELMNDFDSSMIKHSINNYVFYASCAFLGSIQKEKWESDLQYFKQITLNEYVLKSQHFDQEREYDLIQCYIQSLESLNPSKMREGRNFYKKVVKSDAWREKMLNHVEEHLQELITLIKSDVNIQ